jgi:hypothetical protein
MIDFTVWVHCRFEFRRKSARLTHYRYNIAMQLKNHVLYNSYSMSLINHVLYNLKSLNIDYMNSAIVRKCGIFWRNWRGVIVHLIEVFLIAMIYIMYMHMVSSASRLVILILALIINRRYYLDARTAFILLCIGNKMEILNSATYHSIYW